MENGSMEKGNSVLEVKKRNMRKRGSGANTMMDGREEVGIVIM